MQRLLFRFLVPLTGIFLSACAAGNSAIDELLSVDREFSARSVEIGAGPAFVEFASDNARAFPNGGETISGITAVTEWITGWPKERTITWEPEEAYASASGDFGYTWGYATFTSTDEAGKEIVSHGKYVTVWQRQADGKWKWIADLGNSAPSPKDPDEQ